MSWNIYQNSLLMLGQFYQFHIDHCKINLKERFDIEVGFLSLWTLLLILSMSGCAWFRCSFFPISPRNASLNWKVISITRSYPTLPLFQRNINLRYFTYPVFLYRVYYNHYLSNWLRKIFRFDHAKQLTGSFSKWNICQNFPVFFFGKLKNSLSEDNSKFE